MIILDTNVVSEPMKAERNLQVMAWLDAQLAETLFLTAVNLAELLLGIRVLSEGKRRQALAADLGDQIQILFGRRVLPFDDRAAGAYAELLARSRSAGNTVSVACGQIAAIATVRGFAVATRDVQPFLDAGVGVINPWTVKS